MSLTINIEKDYINKKLDKIVSFCKSEWKILLIVLFSFLFRLYFININKALWWDEAEYLGWAKHILTGMPVPEYWPGRPPLLILIACISFLLFGFENLLPLRIIELLTSLGFVFISYFLINEFFGKKIATYTALIVSSLWIEFFYVLRIMTDTLGAFLSLSALLFFVKFYKTNKLKYIFICSLFFSLSVLARYPYIVSLLIFIPFLFLKKDLNLKNKLICTSILLGILFLMILSFGFILNYPMWLSFKTFISQTKPGLQVNGENIWFHPFYYYLQMMPSFLGWIISLFILFGILIHFLDYKLIYKNLIIYLYAILYFFMFSLNFNKQERFLLNIYPILIAIAVFGIITLVNNIKIHKIKSFLPLIIVILVVISQLNHGINIIEFKSDSFYEVKQTAIWIKENSNENDSVFSASIPQINFYSERPTYGFPQNISAFVNKIDLIKPKYIMLSVFEQHPDYLQIVQNMPFLKLEEVFTKQGTQQVVSAVFSINYTLFYNSSFYSNYHSNI